MIEKRKHSKAEDQFDILKFYNFQTSLTDFHMKMVNVIMIQLAFNNELVIERQNMVRLAQLGTEIANLSSDLEQLYKQLNKFGFQNTKYMEIYAQFKLEIMFDEGGSREVLDNIRIFEQKKAKSQQHLLDRRGAIDEDTSYLIISASANAKTIGAILSVGSKIHPMFGYMPHETQGENVRMLMPRLIAKYHDTFVNRYFETGKARLMGMSRDIFGLTKAGYLTYCELFLSVLPLLKEVDSCDPRGSTWWAWSRTSSKRS